MIVAKRIAGRAVRCALTPSITNTRGPEWFHVGPPILSSSIARLARSVRALRRTSAQPHGDVRRPLNLTHKVV